MYLKQFKDRKFHFPLCMFRVWSIHTLKIKKILIKVILIIFISIGVFSIGFLISDDIPALRIFNTITKSFKFYRYIKIIYSHLDSYSAISRNPYTYLPRFPLLSNLITSLPCLHWHNMWLYLLPFYLSEYMGS